MDLILKIYERMFFDVIINKSMQSNQLLKGCFSIALAAILWGSIGFFGRTIASYGLSPEFSGFSRIFSAFICLFMYIAIKDKSLFKIDKRGLFYCAIIGLFTQCFFNISYQNAIYKSSLATAVILLYSSPIFVTILSCIFYKEKLTSNKLFSLFLCILGSFITVTGLSFANFSTNIDGIFYGIFAGFFYSLVPILGKKILSDYSSMTLTFYNFLFGFLALIPFANISQISNCSIDSRFILAFIGFGLFGTVLPYLFYFQGINLGVSPSSASIISTLEIVSSIIFSIILFSENISLIQIIGILIVMLSVFKQKK